MADDGWEIFGDLDELCRQIESGEVAEGYARLQISNEQHLRELAEAAGRVSFPLQTPQAPEELLPERDVAELSQSFKARLRDMLRLHGLVGEEEHQAL